MTEVGGGGKWCYVVVELYTTHFFSSYLTSMYAFFLFYLSYTCRVLRGARSCELLCPSFVLMERPRRCFLPVWFAVCVCIPGISSIVIVSLCIQRSFGCSSGMLIFLCLVCVCLVFVLERVRRTPAVRLCSRRRSFMLCVWFWVLG